MRVFNRLAVLVVGLALVAAGGLIIVEVIWTGVGSGFVWIPGRRWLNTAQVTSRSDVAVVWVSVAVGVAAAVLCVAEIRPWRRRLVQVDPGDGHHWWVFRRSAERHLARQIGATVPWGAVRARLDERAGRWTLKVRVRASRDSGPDLKLVGERELGRLAAPAQSLVIVSTKRPRRAHE